ncbi:MAG: hypothetical protein FJ308_09075 [Planctomycetes bacterium]|nr:hypothetical protein [Planctomycetota bacterium]
MNTRSQYWEWSKPSLVLAIVTVLFAFASLYTQRHIEQYYRSVLASAMEGLAKEETVSDKEIQRADLAIKRLTQSASDPTEMQLMAAKLYDDASRNHAERSRKLREEGNGRQALIEAEQSRLAARRTNDAMRRLGKSNSKLGAEARLWILRDTISNGPLVASESEAFWNHAKSQALQAIEDSAGESDVLLRSTPLVALSTLSNALSVEESGKSESVKSEDQARRRGDVQSLLKDLERVSNEDPRNYMIRLEGIGCLDPGQGVPLARSRLKDLLEDVNEHPGSNNRGIDRRHQEEERSDAVLVSLLALDSTDEAIAYAMNRLNEQSHVDVSDSLRAVLTQSVLRAIGRTYWFPFEDDEANSKRIAGLIKGLVLLGIKYPAVLRFFDRIVDASEADPIASSLSDSVLRGQDSDIAASLGWLRDRFRSRQARFDGAKRPSLEGVSEELASPMLGYIGYLIRERNCDADDAIGAIDEMAQRWPLIGELKVAQGLVAMELGDNSRAIAILSELNDQIPDNAQIQSLLLRAYERALQKR